MCEAERMRGSDDEGSSVQGNRGGMQEGVGRVKAAKPSTVKGYDFTSAHHYDAVRLHLCLTF